MEVGVQWCEVGTRNTRLQEQGAPTRRQQRLAAQSHPPTIAYMSPTTGHSSSPPQSFQKACCLPPKYTQMTKGQPIQGRQENMEKKKKTQELGKESVIKT